MNKEMLESLCLSFGMKCACSFIVTRFPLVSKTDHNASPIPSVFRLFAMPLIAAPFGSFLMLPGMKSLLSGLTDWLVPESQMTVKLSFGSMAALHATGCWRTTDSEKRHSDFFGDPAGVSIGISVGASMSAKALGVGMSLGESVGILLGTPLGVSVGEILGVSPGEQPGQPPGQGQSLGWSLGESLGGL